MTYPYIKLGHQFVKYIKKICAFSSVSFILKDVMKLSNEDNARRKSENYTQHSDRVLASGAQK